MPFFETQDQARARVKRENEEKRRRLEAIQEVKDRGDYVARLAKAAAGHEATGAEQRRAEEELTKAFGKRGAKKEVKKHLERAGAKPSFIKKLLG